MNTAKNEEIIETITGSEKSDKIEVERVIE